MADERPYELLQRGAPTGLVELPVEWILDDAPLFDPRGERYASPREVAQVWIDEFDTAWEERTLFVLTLPPHVSGHRSRLVQARGGSLAINVRQTSSRQSRQVTWSAKATPRAGDVSGRGTS